MAIFYIHILKMKVKKFMKEREKTPEGGGEIKEKREKEKDATFTLEDLNRDISRQEGGVRMVLSRAIGELIREGKIREEDPVSRVKNEIYLKVKERTRDEDNAGETLMVGMLGGAGSFENALSYLDEFRLKEEETVRRIRESEKREGERICSREVFFGIAQSALDRDGTQALHDAKHYGFQEGDLGRKELALLRRNINERENDLFSSWGKSKEERKQKTAERLSARKFLQRFEKGDFNELIEKVKEEVEKVGEDFLTPSESVKRGREILDNIAKEIIETINRGEEVSRYIDKKYLKDRLEREKGRMIKIRAYKEIKDKESKVCIERKGNWDELKLDFGTLVADEKQRADVGEAMNFENNKKSAERIAIEKTAREWMEKEYLEGEGGKKLKEAGFAIGDRVFREETNSENRREGVIKGIEKEHFTNEPMVLLEEDNRRGYTAVPLRDLTGFYKKKK